LAGKDLIPPVLAPRRSPETAWLVCGFVGARDQAGISSRRPSAIWEEETNRGDHKKARHRACGDALCSERKNPLLGQI